MSTSPFPGPVPAESNPIINPQYYAPSRFEISAITLGMTTTVTTSEDHNYVAGQLVKLLIGQPYGTWQLSNQYYYVTSVPADDQVVLQVDSRGMNAFVASPTYGPQPPQIIAVGDINSANYNTSGRSLASTAIPGSFINISPA